MQRLALILFACLLSTGAYAQRATVVVSCGDADYSGEVGRDKQPTVDADGILCASSTGGGGSSVTIAHPVIGEAPVPFISTNSAGTPIASPANSTYANVSDQATATSCLASNSTREGARFYNDSTVVAYLLEDEGTASATNFTVKMNPGDLYILPVNTSGVYTDAVSCIWASDASGAMRVTEIIP